jgi:DNA recombination protein RmuC
MNIAILVALAALFVLLLTVLSRLSTLVPKEPDFRSILQAQETGDRGLREELFRNRTEQTGYSEALRKEVQGEMEKLRTVLESRLTAMETANETKRTEQAGYSEALRKEVREELEKLRAALEGRLTAIETANENKLGEIRATVDEKLSNTLEIRLTQSFQRVSHQMEQVQRGLGEMQTLAHGVGDLKRILTNVKTRGTWGEMQLGALLSEMLTPDQYASNVATTGTSERVEFAIKLPGPDDSGEPVWLPIDAKFPIEDYRRLMDASAAGDAAGVEAASCDLEAQLKACARSISTKYLEPPRTTDFGILFLPIEGLYAEAVRRNGLAERIQREHRILLAGPSTLAALLNSLQMGFRTLAIQKRSSEVWKLLAAVSTEIARYADLLGKLKKKLSEAQSTIEAAETRTRVMERQLRDVETPDRSSEVVSPHGWAALEGRSGRETEESSSGIAYGDAILKEKQ